MNSPRYAPAAWLVTDERAELIRELRRLATARSLTPAVTAYQASEVVRTPPSNSEYGNSPPTTGPWTSGSKMTCIGCGP